MEKNRTWQSFWLTLIVLVVLIALFWLPRISLGGIELRRVNLLSDVQRLDQGGNNLAELLADSLDGYVKERIDSAAIAVPQLAYVDSVPEGMVVIEDFADVDGLHREMDRFYAALDEARQRPVRIAYFGDSYIEGDIITMDLRAQLQQRYGGCGVGLVEISCISSDFRRSVITKRDSWTAYHANEKGRGFKPALQGIAGSYFIPADSATFEMRGTKSLYPGLLDTAAVATLYFTPGEGLSISSSLNRGPAELLYSNGPAQIPETYEELVEVIDSDSIVTYETVTRVVLPEQQDAGAIIAKSVQGRVGRWNLTVQGGTGSRFYGAAFDGTAGISVDNFSLRGSGGQHIGKIPLETLQGFASVRPYDLIVLHFGLNVANEKQKNYAYYASQMGKVIKHLQAAFPKASILVVSVADRDTRGPDGQMHTMDGVRELLSYERKMASDCGVAFWNLYQAMGGDGSIARMAEKKQANLDYTHINFAGGRHLAGLLFDVLMNGKANYDERTH